MTITKAQRAKIRSIIAASDRYDAEGFRITSDGSVHARIDYDKAPNSALSRPTGYFLVGDAADLLASERAR